jgi:hypothetical protein
MFSYVYPSTLILSNLVMSGFQYQQKRPSRNQKLTVWVGQNLNHLESTNKLVSLKTISIYPVGRSMGADPFDVCLKDKIDRDLKKSYPTDTI